MKTNKILLLLLFVCMGMSSFAQYWTSPILTTPTSGTETTSVGAIGEKIRGVETVDQMYAVSSQYEVGSNHCYRDLRVFVGTGNHKATFLRYSHDHNWVTKVLFDPNDPNVIYALYQERRNATDPAGTDLRTYVRRFVYTPPIGGSGSGSITASPRYEVWSTNNSADMVIAPNGDLLVGSVRPGLYVDIKAVRWIPFGGTGYFLTLNNFHVSATGWVNSQNQILSMDMKGNRLVYGHDRNNGIYFKWAAYNSTALTLTSFATILVDNADLYGKTHSNATGSGLKQSVSLRPNGDVYFLQGPTNGSNWILNKLDQQGNVTFLKEGQGHANIVASSNGDCFLAHESTGEFEIELYNGYDEHEHTYTVAAPLNTSGPGVSALNNLAVNGCDLLAVGQINAGDQRHQLFNCEECPFPGGLPTADVELAGNIHSVITLPTYYGPTVTPVYCTMEDVVLDGSGSTCETGYYLRITEIDVATYNPITTLFAGWISTNAEAPAHIQVSDYVGPGVFGYNKNYLVDFTVRNAANSWSSDYKLFRIGTCKTPWRSEIGPIAQDNVGPLQDRAGSFDAEVFPNPSTGLINISVQNQTANTTYQIVDMTGKVVANGSFIGTQSLDLTGEVATGMYMIQLENIDGYSIEKLMVK